MSHYHYLTIEQRERLDAQIRARIAELERALETAAPEPARAELREMRAARARLHTPDYGVCADCGVDIPYVRLETAPTATRCAACQARVEHAPGADGTPGR